MLKQRPLLTAAILVTLAGPVMAQTAPAAQPQPPADQPQPPAAAAAPTVAITPGGDIIGTLKASGQFTILLKALDASNLTGFLQGAGPYTIFAPTDAAFQALPAGALDNLMKPDNAAQLQALLAYHLINAAVPTAKIQGTKGPIPTAAQKDIQVDGTGTPLKVNNADIEGQGAASNGLVYAIDKVLTPPS
jgi:uncharacterized surface protein with fasciclin (FAS1) repeats